MTGCSPSMEELQWNSSGSSTTVWREAPFYTDRERAALAWAEAVTLLPANSMDERATGAQREARP